MLSLFLPMIDICGMLPQNTLKKTVRCVKRKISDQATQDPLDLQAHHQRPEGTDGWNPTLPVDTVDGNQKSGDHQLRLVEVVYPIIYKVVFSYQAVVGDFVHQQYGRLSHDFQGFIHVKVVVWDFWTINSTTCWFFLIPCVLFLVVLAKDSIFFLNEGMAHSFCLEEWSFGFGRAII